MALVIIENWGKSHKVIVRIKSVSVREGLRTGLERGKGVINVIITITPAPSACVHRPPMASPSTHRLYKQLAGCSRPRTKWGPDGPSHSV